jgi:uncharacterized LabA/DUF88 family protein
MFNPKTEKIAELARKNPHRIQELENIFDKETNVYIDFANVFRWQEKLEWHISLKRLKQLLDSFTNVNKIKFYSGTLVGDTKSERLIAEAKALRYDVVTKPVKIMRLSIDISSIPPNSPEILKQFIRDSLLKKLNIETIEFLNSRLKELNQQGIMFIEDLKCNFDVEIGRDMQLDYHQNKVQNFILWSGDSDFADPLKQLLLDGKKVGIFATVRKIATELNDLKDKGLFIFEIQKLRDFICWPRDSRSI